MRKRLNCHNGVTVSHRKSISELFVHLEQTGSLETALSDGVRVACEATGCAAGAVAAELDPTHAASRWFAHDPHGLFESAAFEAAALQAPDGTVGDSNAVVSGAKATLRQVSVPLCCAGRNVGRLILLAPHTLGAEQFRTRITGITAVLAVLMAAAEGTAAGPLSAVLSGPAFRARLVSEISRSQRGGDELSVLHVRVASARRRDTRETAGLWAHVASLGEALVPRLRASDVVGLLAPDHLAVLLTGTGRLGARIAARRIELLLPTSAHDSSSRPNLGVGPPEFCLRTFPEDGEDPDSLCRAPQWRSETIAPAVARVSPK